MDYKAQGNLAHNNRDYRQAIFHFSKGLEASEPAQHHLLYSNRSASYFLLGDFERALADADQVVKLRPQWAKGWSRKATALEGLKRFAEALAAYEKAMSLEPESEAAKTAYQQCKAAKERNECKPFDSTISEATLSQLEKTKTLHQLPDVIWHLEILKERIWLQDPPKSAFRPRSIFVIDSTKLQMVHVKPHPTRDSITLDELLDMLAQTCAKHHIRPGAMEFSDKVLTQVLSKHLADLSISCSTVPLSQEKRKFFDLVFSSFEEQERHAWAGNPQYAGIIVQREQGGLLSAPGVTPGLVANFFKAAAAFYRSRAYLYFTQPIGLRADSGEMAGEARVTLVVKSPQGHYGLTVSPFSALPTPGTAPTAPLAGVSCLFMNPDEIPFADADAIEQHGWEIADEKYPFPVVNPTTQDNQPAARLVERPSAADLKWLEVAFRSVALFIANTYANPTFIPTGALGCRCLVNTSAGKACVVVSTPADEKITPTGETFHEAAPGTTPNAGISATNGSPVSPNAAAPSFHNVPYVPPTSHSPPPSHAQPTAPSPVALPTLVPTVNQLAPTPSALSSPSPLPASPTGSPPITSPAPTFPAVSEPYTPAAAQADFDSHRPASPLQRAFPPSQPVYPPASTMNMPTPRPADANSEDLLQRYTWQERHIEAQQKLISELSQQLNAKDAQMAALHQRIRELEATNVSLLKESSSKSRIEITDARTIATTLSQQLQTVVQSIAAATSQIQGFQHFPPSTPPTHAALSHSIGDPPDILLDSTLPLKDSAARRSTVQEPIQSVVTPSSHRQYSSPSIPVGRTTDVSARGSATRVPTSGRAQPPPSPSPTQPGLRNFPDPFAFAPTFTNQSQPQPQQYTVTNDWGTRPAGPPFNQPQQHQQQHLHQQPQPKGQGFQQQPQPQPQQSPYWNWPGNNSWGQQPPPTWRQ